MRMIRDEQYSIQSISEIIQDNFRQIFFFFVFLHLIPVMIITMNLHFRRSRINNISTNSINRKSIQFDRFFIRESPLYYFSSFALSLSHHSRFADFIHRNLWREKLREKFFRLSKSKSNRMRERKKMKIR